MMASLMSSDVWFVLAVFMMMVMGVHSGGATSRSHAAASLQYWEKTLPDVALPLSLQERLSPLDSSAESYYKGLLARGRTPLISGSSLCKAGHLYCSADEFASFRFYTPACTIQLEFVNPSSYETADAKGARQKVIMSQGGFFRERELAEGAELLLGDQKDTVPTMPFLPRDLAELLMSSAGVNLFNIPTSSLLARESKQTLQLCRVDPKDILQGEEAFCASSLEDLADHLKSMLLLKEHQSSSVQKKTLHLLPVSSAMPAAVTAKLVKVELQASDDEPYLSCHTVTYPFALHFCHHIPNTRIYAATFQQDHQLIHAAAICHMDTREWSPLHVAFADLNSSPGHTEACHWTHEHGLIFVTRPASA